MPEPEWVLLSEIEHWAYCPRQWAIIHLEQHFNDNDDTTRGQLAHERVDKPGHQQRHDTTTFWALDVASDIHHLRGRCDRVIRQAGSYIPVEHKSGRRSLEAARLQLVGQAICLEEMTQTSVTEGRIYHAASNQTDIIDVVNPETRQLTFAIADQIRAARQTPGGRLPPAANDVRCPGCSLRDTCLPELVAAPARQRGLHGGTFKWHS
jgi:CRISPR-associated exonuclease Cas4